MVKNFLMTNFFALKIVSQIDRNLIVHYLGLLVNPRKISVCVSVMSRAPYTHAQIPSRFYVTSYQYSVFRNVLSGVCFSLI